MGFLMQVGSARGKCAKSLNEPAAILLLQSAHVLPNQARVSQNSRRLFGPEKLFYVQAIHQQEIHFSLVLKAKRKNLRSTRNFALVFGLKLNSKLKEIEFQKSLSGPKSLWVF